MPMQPRPISETSGPWGPSLRLSMTHSFRLAVRSRPRRAGSPARYITVRAAAGGRAFIHATSVERPMFPLNLPNVLTVLRIMLVPVLVVALLGDTQGGDV